MNALSGLWGMGASCVVAMNQAMGSGRHFFLAVAKDCVAKAATALSLELGTGMAAELERIRFNRKTTFFSIKQAASACTVCAGSYQFSS
ncbi:hypothetical protein [Polaromonas sp.]|uniref:hypothetical protein n=1 Tax=Polaromonas sp. TaxID=1869339 RepID=UPI003BB6FE2C